MPSPPSPSVASYTRRAPYAVGPKEPLGNARRLMDKYGIRHLPVKAEGKLVGILSGRDLRLVWSLMHPPPETRTVDEAMTTDPYVVAQDTSIDEVVRVMVEKDRDAAVVLDEGRIVGVFTPADAMEALVDILEPKRTRTDERTRSAQPRRGRDTR